MPAGSQLDVAEWPHRPCAKLSYPGICQSLGATNRARHETDHRAVICAADITLRPRKVVCPSLCALRSALALYRCLWIGVWISARPKCACGVAWICVGTRGDARRVGGVGLRFSLGSATTAFITSPLLFIAIVDLPATRASLVNTTKEHDHAVRFSRRDSNPGRLRIRL